MTATIPRAVESITVDWLATLGVAYAGEPPAGPLAVERIGVASGLVGLIYRVQTGGSPATVVVKCCDPERQERLRAVHRREAHFAAAIAHRAGIRVPRTYRATFDPETLEMVIVMEDIGHLRFPAGAFSESDRAIAIAGIAGMHARWWNAPELFADAEFLTAEAFCRERAPGLAEEVEAFASLYPGRFPAGTMALLHRLPEAFAREVIIDDGPRTLCHGDYSSKNLAIDDGAGEVVVFDWAQYGRFSPARDLYTLVAYSTRPDRIAASWSPAIDGYSAALASRGIAWERPAIEDALRQEAVAMLSREVATMAHGTGPAMEMVVAHNLNAIPTIIDSLGLHDFLDRRLAG